jgi:hypothetical protein
MKFLKQITSIQVCYSGKNVQIGMLENFSKGKSENQ